MLEKKGYTFEISIICFTIPATTFTYGTLEKRPETSARSESMVAELATRSSWTLVEVDSVWTKTIDASVGGEPGRESVFEDLEVDVVTKVPEPTLPKVFEESVSKSAFDVLLEVLSGMGLDTIRRVLFPEPP